MWEIVGTDRRAHALRWALAWAMATSLLFSLGAEEMFAPGARMGGSAFFGDICLWDFDEDGLLDSVYSYLDPWYFYDSRAMILRNIGDRMFEQEALLRLDTVPQTYLLTSGQFNGDQRTELLAVCAPKGDLLMFTRNDSGLTGRRLNRDSPAVLSVSAQDMNGDEFDDLILAEFHQGSVGVLLSDGQGSFQEGGSFPAVPHCHAVAAGDIDGDEDLDLGIGSLDSPALAVLRNDGSGMFGSPEFLELSSNVLGVAIEDFDSDGDNDLMTCTPEGIEVRLNDGSGGFGSPKSFPSRDTCSVLATADFDRDGDIDIALGMSSLPQLEVLLNSGPAKFHTAQLVDLTGDGPTSGVAHLRVSDLDRDGWPDIVAVFGGTIWSIFNCAGDTPVGLLWR